MRERQEVQEVLFERRRTERAAFAYA